MTLLRQDDEVEVLVGLDQGVHHEIRVVDRHIVIHRAVGEQQLPFQIGRNELVGLRLR